VALAREARAVVKGADTSRMVDDVLAARGGSVRTTTPGELHLVEALGAEGDLAGEGNGGVVVPAVGMARDALAAAAAILELMARTKRPISALAAELPRYFRRRSTVACAGEEDARIALDAVAASVGVSPAVDPEQGVVVEAADGAWGLVRRSATEPVLRITVEAPTEAAADALHAEVRAALPAGVES
jgi:phosphomannomutase